MFPEPPQVHFDNLPSAGVQIRVGGKQTISATVSGTPFPQVSWYKDGKPLEPSVAKTEVGEFSTHIIFTDADIEATGNYRVAVANEAGSSSADVYVTVKGGQLLKYSKTILSSLN